MTESIPGESETRRIRVTRSGNHGPGNARPRRVLVSQHRSRARRGSQGEPGSHCRVAAWGLLPGRMRETHTHQNRWCHRPQAGSGRLAPPSYRHPPRVRPESWRLCERRDFRDRRACTSSFGGLYSRLERVKSCLRISARLAVRTTRGSTLGAFKGSRQPVTGSRVSTAGSDAVSAERTACVSGVSFSGSHHGSYGSESGTESSAFTRSRNASDRLGGL